MPSFSVGQEVVCVDDDLHEEMQVGVEVGSLLLEKGKIYHIRWCGRPYKDDDREYVLLYEIRRDIMPFIGIEFPYFAFRFAPTVKDKLDVFRKMLNPDPELIMLIQEEYIRQNEEDQKTKKKERV